ncbi:hypothetical protein [Lewinella cohaerens]|uniref:hypothetical protein n=1 Tax=Lewinella cohaerens TaxID=70995 RepID=UPI0003618F08|nr:hypothetical protein [Lewinella cohaerens]
MINPKGLLKTIVLTLLIAQLLSCQEQLNYPEIIVENSLQEIYDQSIIDWHILNSTGTYSEASYLLLLDSLVNSKIYMQDSLMPGRVLNSEMVRDKKLMTKLFPDHIFEFLEIDLEIFEHEKLPILRGDTVVITHFPLVSGYQNEMIYDPIDGDIHTIYYVNSKVIKVGMNDNAEFDINNERLRSHEPKLRQLIISRGKKKVNKRLWRLMIDK